MSILTELNRIEAAKSSLVDTAKEWGLITETEANGIKIETVASEYAGVTVQTPTDTTVDVQKSYTVPAGYYPGSFTVANAIQSVISQDNVEIEEGNAETFSAGYYPNAFVVTAKSGVISPEETPGTATTESILLGKTAWVNGAQITGAMPDKGNVVVELTNTDRSYTIPTGYHAGGGQVYVAGDFIGSDITQYGEDDKVTLYETDSPYTIPEGYYDGTSTVTVATHTGTYTVSPELTSSTIIIDATLVGADRPGYYMNQVTVDMSEIEARLAAI